MEGQNMKKTFITCFIIVFMSLFLFGTLQAGEFLYTGDKGPAFWGELNPDWEACLGKGGMQSPIDINNVRNDWRLSPLKLHLDETEIHMINNGHAIELEYEEGSTLKFEGVVYDLLQFHFHTLSEHTVEGNHGAMELHAVFKNMESGKLAVIGMLYSIGSENHFLQELIDAGLPKKEGDETLAWDINLDDGLTNTSSYYTYQGSLTTPPCSEIVTWIVLKQAAEMSEQQFQEFRKILGNDFRPLQERNNREVRATVKYNWPVKHHFFPKCKK